MTLLNEIIFKEIINGTVVFTCYLPVDGDIDLTDRCGVVDVCQGFSKLWGHIWTLLPQSRNIIVGRAGQETFWTLLHKSRA